MAVIGNTQQRFPWQGNWNKARANSVEAGIGRTIAVGLYPLGRSLFGVDDMAGNIWEWCLSTYVHSSRISSATLQRGGSWRGNPGGVRASACFDYPPVARVEDVGFRVLCSSPIE